ncbi:MAG: fumarylacetoacetate hydrolase family protein [Bacteroidota bacterium]|nr:fumarylacetoacetate hydrolase family protein [Bacteroidota bacterium]
MNIFCIGLNYSEHIKEFDRAHLPEAPVIFMKPDTAILKDNEPFYYPAFSKNIHFEVEILVKIAKNGKNILPDFSYKYYNEIGVGIDFTARDLQSELKSKGMPWEISKGFNGSAPISKFVPKTNFKDVQNINFSLVKNGQLVQSGNTSDMISKVDQIIAHISTYFLLKQGDIIFTGTPKGVGPVQIGDKLECFIENQKMLECEIK